MHCELANTEATSILRRKRGEGGKRSVPVLLYGSDPNSSDPIYRHCAACKAPQHLTVQCREWPAAKPRSSLPPALWRDSIREPARAFTINAVSGGLLRLYPATKRTNIRQFH